MSRKGRNAAPAILGVLKILGALRTPFATQGRSYKRQLLPQELECHHCGSRLAGDERQTLQRLNRSARLCRYSAIFSRS